MKFTVVKDPIPFLIIDNTYDKDELVQVYSEIDFLNDKLLEPLETGSAELGDGVLKSNKGVFLDDFYLKNKIKSNILEVNRKLFSFEVKNILKQCHYAYDLLSSTNTDTSLLSYYGDNDSYFWHKDASVISMVTWFYRTPKNFTGGEFIFTDYNLSVDIQNNRTVIFFGSYAHEVTKVILKDKTLPFSGRYTISNFSNIGPTKI